ncbi:MAG: substrate-binding domain-containing protein, partial [Chloroflexi bacterium]|nr:substrate-binding domain-containing protein [Chloroflexota bacterium]
ALDYSYVDLDGAAGVTAALAYLAGQGHRRIAFVTPPRGLMCTRQRMQGYRCGLQDNGLPFEADYVIEGGFNERAGQIAAHLLLDLPRPPTAILAANDICAFGVMRALQVRGLQAGRDVSVVGFDDISLANHWHPTLTTISQPFRKIGFALMQSLLAVISGGERLPQTVLEPGLVVRLSSGPAPAA